MVQLLLSLNLGQFEPSFRKTNFDGGCFKLGFDDDTLAELGVTLKAHRQKLKDAHAEYFGAVSGTVS